MALLKVTELTLSSDDINGTGRVSTSFFSFFYASEVSEEWPRSSWRESAVCHGAGGEGGRELAMARYK